ncbi:uncharacterized protein LOC143596391 [Bidens hawaiensis]|uniref:uncharacterized protein LOC143596391 n=1 Tax=Bidens hawaiensis TaxID=980011 RepID=UPI0040494852
MKLRSNRVFKREKPKIQKSFKNKGYSLRSNKSKNGKKVDTCYENLEMGMKGLNSDDKGLFLGSEVLDPMEDLDVSCPKEETEEEEVNESMSVNLSEMDVGVKEEDESLELEALDECKVTEEKGRCGKKKKNVGSLKEVESNQEKIDVVVVDDVNDDDDDDAAADDDDDDDDTITVMALKRKRRRKRIKVEALSSECNVRDKTKKVVKEDDRVSGGDVAVDDGFKSVVLGLKRSDDVPKSMLKHETKKENKRPKKKLKKQEKPCKLQATTSGDVVAAVDGGSRTVVLGLISGDIPINMLKRRGRPPKALTEGENTKPKKKLKKRERPCKLQSEITTLPLSEIPSTKLERRGRPRKGVIVKKIERRGRPKKMEARTLAANMVKMRKRKLMSVKKSLKIGKNENFEENSDQIVRNLAGRKQLKQLLREKISNLFSKCGWTVDLRQRQEKTYLDAVYIEPNGKRSHWSITAAYAKLKQKIENGEADDCETSAFTPIPEEEISMLFRQPRKVRKHERRKKLKNAKKGKIVTGKKKKLGKNKKSKDVSKRKMLFKPRENGDKQDNKGVSVIKKRNLLSWMIDSGVILAGTKVEYGKTRRQKRSSEGVITNDGIRCGCCNEIMGITKFVGHCGGNLKFGRFFDDLYLESGMCVRKCLLDSWKKEEESDIINFNVDIQEDDPNDDTCNICGDGGDLICCDGCPSTFHQSCLDVQNFPTGDWNCVYCSCKFCGVVSDSTPQVENLHDEITSQMLSCCLCEEKFHQLCVQETEDVNQDLKRQPFCGRKCQELFERLQANLGVKYELEDGFSWTLLKRSEIDQDFSVPESQLKIEHNSKLAIAFSVMDECFVPVVDERSGTNIIRNVVYNCGSNFKRLNYASFLTAVLEKDDEFITAASIRIHGYRLAEMPFIGTRHIYRRQGMCRRLLDAIESTLSSFGVEELIIPAIPALLQTWTDVFGFMPLEDSQKQVMKRMSMIVFPGIDMLKKPLVHNQSADVAACHTSPAGVVEDSIVYERKEETVSLMDGCSSPDHNDENTPQVETTSSNATDCKPMEKETVLTDCCSCPDLENVNGVNNLCDLNLPDGQTSVDSESFPDCTIGPSSLESGVCGNPELSELKLDAEAEDDGVPVVKVNPSPLTSESVLKNTFDLNLDPTVVETDVHIIIDDSVQCEPRPCVKSFELSDSRSQVDQSAGGQTDSKICECQPLVMH